MANSYLERRSTVSVVHFSVMIINGTEHGICVIDPIHGDERNSLCSCRCVRIACNRKVVPAIADRYLRVIQHEQDDDESYHRQYIVLNTESHHWQRDDLEDSSGHAQITC